MPNCWTCNHPKVAHQYYHSGTHCSAKVGLWYCRCDRYKRPRLFSRLINLLRGKR